MHMHNMSSVMYWGCPELTLCCLHEPCRHHAKEFISAVSQVTFFGARFRVVSVGATAAHAQAVLPRYVEDAQLSVVSQGKETKRAIIARIIPPSPRPFHAAMPPVDEASQEYKDFLLLVEQVSSKQEPGPAWRPTPVTDMLAYTDPDGRSLSWIDGDTLADLQVGAQKF